MRVIHDPKGAKLEPGEVLVAPSAVVGVAAVTERLRTGQRVRVDGESDR